MSVIYDWIKDILYYLILISLVYQLLPNENYRKYMKLFSGILLVIIVLKPLKIFIQEDSLDSVKAAFQQYDSNDEEIKAKVEEFKDEQEQLSQEYVSEQLKEQVQKIVEDRGFYIESAHVETQDDKEVLCINILRGDTTGKDIVVEAVQIKKEEGQEHSTENEKIIKELKKEVADYYKVKEDLVQIQLGGA